MKNFFALSILCLGFFSLANANSPHIIQESFAWVSSAETVWIAGERYERWSFRGAHFPEETPGMPFYVTDFPVESAGQLSVEVVAVRYEPLPEVRRLLNAEEIGEELSFRTNVAGSRGRYRGYLAFTPIIREGGRYAGVAEMTLRITLRPQEATAARPKVDPTNFTSVLRNGEVYKIGVAQAGIYRLTYDFLKSELGLNPDNIDPRRLGLYGQGGGMLPADVDAPRVDDLQEVPITVVGEADGRFDPGDYLLFYAEGADRWRFDPVSRTYNMEKNVFADRNFYFLKVKDENGARLEEQPSLGNTGYTTTTFLDYYRFEEDKSNLLHDWEKTQGSGQRWFGDRFKVAREYNYPALFTIPNLVTEAPVRVRARAALRALTRSRFFVDINGQTLTSSQANAVSRLSGNGDNETTYAHLVEVRDSVLLSGGTVDVSIRYPFPAPNDGSEGWVDYVQLNVRRQLTFTAPQLAFRDPATLDHAGATYQLSGAAAGLVIWDITDPLAPRRQAAAFSGGQLSFGADAGGLREFVAFDPAGALPLPEAVGRIDNQNLHAIDNVDMLIVYHPDFEPEAERLAEHRRNHTGLAVAVADINQIYNEFSSGRLDPTAIRDFAKLLSARNDRFRYLLLFGDGSFDYRDIYGLGNNYIPVYENESLHPIYTYPTDDYFVLLNNGGAGDPLIGVMDVAVGRLPVKSPQEAAVAVDKIIRYETDPLVLRDWRNRIVFLGDDQDGNRHTGDADQIAVKLGNSHPFLNVDKVYLDAFPQESTPGGDRFPQATEAINRAIFKGVLVMTYLGHGGPEGLAQERVLNISDILSWENRNQLPLIVTATCSFTGYDDPSFVTAGEEAFLNPRGGAIALFTTTRAVFASQNAILTDRSLTKLFERVDDGDLPTLGEAFVAAKNTLTAGGSGFSTSNARKFSLIGDPAMRLAIPEYRVLTTRMDGEELQSGQTDTLRALQQITIAGQITDNIGQLLTDFNGIIYPTVFDKASTVNALQQDSDSPAFSFQIQKNVIFKGRASVTNGAFEFSFVVPKDINYDYGFGKISYYAADEGQFKDATGSYQQVIIGGTQADGIADDQGPRVDVFMNSEDFVFGGITDENPVLLVKLEDDFGINVTGNSIGHDLEGVLNGDTENTYLLNDFYEAELDDYTKGIVRFPLNKIPEGRHEISVKAWDVANNSSQGYTEFVVASSAEVALRHVLNYPNPFTDRTCFQFDHNMGGQELDVLIHIYTVSGRLVKTIEESVLDDGAIRLDNCIEWDGRDDYGDRLARGVYLYKVQVRAALAGEQQLSGESEFEKLVILK